MEQNNKIKQDDFSEFDLDTDLSADSLSETIQSTPIADVVSDTVVNNTNTFNADDSSLLELDIDESLLDQFNSPEPEVKATPQPASHKLEQDIDKLFDDIPLNQAEEQSPMMQIQESVVSQPMNDKSLELEFDLQNELHDSPVDTHESAISDLNTHTSTDLGLATNANSTLNNNMLNNSQFDNGMDNTSTNHNVMPETELSLMVDEPIQSVNQFNQGLQANPHIPPVPNMPNSTSSSMGQVQPQHSQLQGQPPSKQPSGGLFNMPVDGNENMGTHLGQSVGTIKARPPEENVYAASSRMDSDDFGGYEEGNDSTWYNLSGRIGRLRYVSYGFFIIFLMYLLLFFIGAVMGAIGAGEGLVTFFAVILALPFSLLSGFIYPIRRLNDLGHTGWLCLLGLIPLINLILYLYLTFAPGNDGFNEYGAPPRENQWYHWVGAIVVPFGFIALIGILAAIALPAYQDYVERAGAATSIESVE